MPHIDQMLELAKKAQKNAYAPYSKFFVGCCIKAEDGTLFAGCNVENASYGLAYCAEVTAIGHLVAAGKKRIKEVVVIGPKDFVCVPCGRCRQNIKEFAADDVLIHCFNHDGSKKDTYTLKEILPFAFGPDSL